MVCGFDAVEILEVAMVMIYVFLVSDSARKRGYQWVRNGKRCAISNYMNEPTTGDGKIS